MLGKISLLFLLTIGLLILAVWIQEVDPVQRDPERQVYVFPDSLAALSFDLDSLLVEVGDNKGLPPGFETAALLAYSAYPQLKDVPIVMELTQSGAPMESTFDYRSLFGWSENRAYRILLNDAPDTEFNEILLRSLPFDAQVGILAHELGHVVYYHKLSILQIAKWGIKYLIDNEFRALHERTTDLMPVYHGLGSQIFQYARYVRHDPRCRTLYLKYTDFIDTYYMTDQELLQALKTHRLYSDYDQW